MSDFKGPAMEDEATYPAFPPHPRPLVSIGQPFAQACLHHAVHSFNAQRAYLVVSRSISKTVAFTTLRDALGPRLVGVRFGIRQHVIWIDVLELATGLHDADADLIITLGAGSLTDAAKVASFAFANGAFTLNTLDRLHVRAKTDPATLKGCSIPIINIPTSLSGGEYSTTGGATDPRTHIKSSFQHPTIGASLVILDPALTVSTPERVWLSSGMRAVDHCIEGLCSVYFSASPTAAPDKQIEVQSALEKGLRLLLPSLLITKDDPQNLPARRDEMLGVVEAMRGLKAGVPMGASHGIGHQLGPLGVGHGETSCVMLPSVLRYNARNGGDWVVERQRRTLRVFWEDESLANRMAAVGLDQQTSDLADVVSAYVKLLGLPSSLSSVGVDRGKLATLAQSAMTDRYVPTNPAPITRVEQVEEILELAFGRQSG